MDGRTPTSDHSAPPPTRSSNSKKPMTKASIPTLSPVQADVLEALRVGGTLTVNTWGGANYLRAGDRSQYVQEPTLRRLRKLRAIEQIERQYPILTFGISKRGEELLEQYRTAAKKKKEKGESDR